MRVRNPKKLATAATIAALAFGKTPAQAVAVWPILFLGMVGSWPFGRVYLTDDRNGTVTVTPRGWRRVLGIVVALLLILLSIVIVANVVALMGPAGKAILTIVQVIVVVLCAWIIIGMVILVAGAALSSNRSVSFRETGPETPRGRRYTITSLAQRPGTSFSALLAARQAVSELPPESIAVACAATLKLRDLYVKRGGFTAGHGLRVYLVTPPCLLLSPNQRGSG